MNFPRRVQPRAAGLIRKQHNGKEKVVEVEIWLDTKDAEEANLPRVYRRFMEWYHEGAEVRPNKMCFGSINIHEEPYRYTVDLGYADMITAFKNLHARLHRLGVKVFIHFSP
jgi:hypothetical protein